MKILLIIALVFTALTALMAVLPAFGGSNEADSDQATAGLTVLLIIFASIFYALWALAMLFHYLLN